MRVMCARTSACVRVCVLRYKSSSVYSNKCIRRTRLLHRVLLQVCIKVYVICSRTQMCVCTLKYETFKNWISINAYYRTVISLLGFRAAFPFSTFRFLFRFTPTYSQYGIIVQNRIGLYRVKITL